MGDRAKSEVTGYLFLLPAFAFLAIVYGYSLIQLIPLSLTRQLRGTSAYVGIENYRFLIFDDKIVRVALLNNLTLLLVIPILVGLSILSAAILFDIGRGSRFYRSIILVPYLLSVVVSSIVMGVLLQDNGLLNLMLRSLGLDFLALSWLGSTQVAIFSVMGVMVWRELGFGSMLFLARMTQIPADIFDAAKVDGCSWPQQLIWVTIPQLRSLISFYVVFLIIIVFSWSFNYVYVMTTGGPGYSTTILELVIFRYATIKKNPEIAAALSVLVFFLIFGFIYLQLRTRRLQQTD